MESVLLLHGDDNVKRNFDRVQQSRYIFVQTLGNADSHVHPDEPCIVLCHTRQTIRFYGFDYLLILKQRYHKAKVEIHV